MSLNAYRAYGLSIHTEFACPELLSHSCPTDAPDVTITLLAQNAGFLRPVSDRCYDLQPGCFQLDVPGLAHYRVEEGQRILIQPLPGASPEQIRLFLFGSAMGALLYQRGLFPLHGSAVLTQWGAMIFVGLPGSGKSTLAAEFHRRGYAVLSDDVCAIESTPEGLRILPALNQFRLCANAYEQLGPSPEAYFDVDKFAVPMGEQYCPDPAPLRAIHILSDDDSVDLPRFELVRGLDRVRYLFENLYRPHFLNGQRTQTDLVRLAGRIAQHATLATVSRRRDATAAAEVARFLELTWSECFRTSCNEEEEFHALFRS